ncbi:hypothetical protein N4T77_19785 [Clostridium sp. CX1]|uniref:DUF4304 domain-containing protein n=1 Tax=Clostridium tanneri TaxID=3037988 RepID=A0ABU4JYC7_9CLOT|nr:MULTISPECIES: hypothetical protein [unclassified Clostridium]MCT8978823.1 hypothetical protein [Clostridium sp. CX1]MDW8803148.1 hypothetical protein [Clostridium sp. A1-XYC3]
MIDKKRLKKEILKEVANGLSNYGFDKKVYGQSFWKVIDNGRTMIHISFIEHDNDFDAVISVSIRFDSLEEMINIDNKLLTSKEKQQTSTLGIELGNLNEGRQRRLIINEKSNIKCVGEEILNTIKNVALPYIDKYQSMEDALVMMLRDDPEVWIFSPLHHKRAMNAIGLAKLLGKDNIKEISEKKIAFLKSINDYGLNMVMKFTERVLK